MALISGILLSRHAADQPEPADPTRALAVVNDGMRTTAPR